MPNGMYGGVRGGLNSPYSILYYRKVLAEIKLCKLMILPKEGIENRR